VRRETTGPTSRSMAVIVAVTMVVPVAFSSVGLLSGPLRPVAIFLPMALVMPVPVPVVVAVTMLARSSLWMLKVRECPDQVGIRLHHDERRA
jgi:hypothetical protein